MARQKHFQSYDQVHNVIKMQIQCLIQCSGQIIVAVSRHKNWPKQSYGRTKPIMCRHTVSVSTYQLLAVVTTALGTWYIAMQLLAVVTTALGTWYIAMGLMKL